MNLLPAVATFVVILPAELPDKTMVATLVMSTRMRPAWVWTGAAAAFSVQVVIAVALGGVIDLFPHVVVEGFVAAVLAGTAAWLLLGRESAEVQAGTQAAAAATGVADPAGLVPAGLVPTGPDAAGPDAAGPGAPAGAPGGSRGLPGGPSAALRQVGGAFAVVFLAEFGDLTQIVTADLAARYHDPVAVGLGAIGALWIAAAVGVVAGATVLTRLPLTAVRRGAGVVLAGLAIYTVVQLLL